MVCLFSDNVGVGCTDDWIGRLTRRGDAIYLSPLWEGGFFVAFLDGDGVSGFGGSLSRRDDSREIRDNIRLDSNDCGENGVL